MVKRALYILILALGLISTCVATDWLQWHWEAAAFNGARAANLSIMAAVGNEDEHSLLPIPDYSAVSLQVRQFKPSEMDNVANID